jgi:NADH-quinone oxidoreductase subunit A
MAFIIIGLSRLLGKPTHSKIKDIPYESGIAPTGTANVRTSIPYYLVAIFFLMFDVEIAYLYAYGVSVRDLGWDGFLKAMIFIGFLAGGLVYIWLRGGLEWRRPSKTAPKNPSSSHV